jgi:hypothetical protein
MAFLSGSTVQDNSASLFELVTERLRNDAFSLIFESQAYLKEANLPRFGDATEEELVSSRETYRLANRLKDIMARAISLHAWSIGKITTEYALASENLLRFRDECLESRALSGRSLTTELCALSERSILLYERACRLENMLLDFYDMPSNQSEAA